MTRSSILIVSAIVGAALIMAWIFRFDTVASPNTLGVFVTDRWTGETRFCAAGECAPVSGPQSIN
jgi:hypothetical protein